MHCPEGKKEWQIPPEAKFPILFLEKFFFGLEEELAQTSYFPAALKTLIFSEICIKNKQSPNF
jgi:hypothetical protein